MAKKGKLINWRNRTGELVVKPRYSPRVKLFVAGLAAVLLIVTGGAIYNHGMNMAGFDRLSAYQHQQVLRSDVDRLRQENQGLREGLARAQRDVQMDQTAYQELDQSLKDSAKQIQKLQEEVSFYRNIISPTNKIAGLQIQSLRIKPMPGSSNQYQYSLVLIQALKHDQTIYGRARFEISGVRAGQDVVLAFPARNDKPITVNFKYFQELDGNIQLAGDFKPQRVKVSVTTTGAGAQTLEQSYNWPNL